MYRRLSDPESTPDTGSLRGDLLAAFRELASRLHGPSGAALRGVLGDGGTQAVLLSRSRGRGAALLAAIVERAEARGELPTAALPPRRLEAGHALLRHEFLMRGELPDGVLVELVDDVMLPLLAAPA